MLHAEPFDTCRFIEEICSFKSAKLPVLWLWSRETKQRIIQYLQDGKTTESGLTRQTETWGKTANDFKTGLSWERKIVQRKETQQRDFFFWRGVGWGATYFSMRSSVTPGTNLALFCIQNLKDKTYKGWKKLLQVVKQMRSSDKKKMFGFYITHFMTYNHQEKHSSDKWEPKKNDNHWVLWWVDFGWHTVRGRWQETKSYFRAACLLSASGSGQL